MVDIHGTPGDGDARLLRAGFESKSRQRKVQALTTVETYLNEDFDRQEEKIRTHAGGEDFLRRGRVEVLGADRQPETLADRGAVIVAAAVHLRQAETERREARHQMVSDMPVGAERLRAAGWEEARTDNEKDQVLTTVEQDFVAAFDHREQQLRTDDEGEAFLRRGRVEVLKADREPKTLAERDRVIARAEALRQAAVAERRATKQRVARLKRLFAAPVGDEALFASLDARQPTWRERETGSADIDFALDRAEQRVDRTQPTTAEHEVVVDAEQTFVTASSSVWRQAGERFPEGSTQARSVSRRLSDRARVRALVAEREEPPASPELVKRVFDWLQTQVEKLLQRPRPGQAGDTAIGAGGRRVPAGAACFQRPPSKPAAVDRREGVGCQHRGTRDRRDGRRDRVRAARSGLAHGGK